MSDAVVVGAGIIGLATALRLVEKGFQTEIWARELPEHTTSAIPAAIWYPYRCEPAGKVKEWAIASHAWLRGNPLKVADESGVREIDFVEYTKGADPKELAWSEDLWSRLDVKSEPVPAGELPSALADDGGWIGNRRRTIVMDTTRFLPWLVARLASKGVKPQKKDLMGVKDLPKTRVVINCAGLGGAVLSTRDELRRFRMRGQILRFPRPEDPAQVPACVIAIESGPDDEPPVPTYVVPREGDLIVGGSDRELEDSEDPEQALLPSKADEESILERARMFGPEYAFNPKEMLEQPLVGFRPGRDAVRLEPDPELGNVIHNYGHGGSGFTVAFGCAAEVVELAKDVSRPTGPSTRAS